MRTIGLMALALSVVILINWFSPGRTLTSAAALSGQGKWRFVFDDGSTLDPAPPGVALYDLVSRGASCCSGRYEFRGTVPKATREPLYLYLPAIGGALKSVIFNGKNLPLPPSAADLSSVGPIFPLLNEPVDNVTLSIAIDGPPSRFAGLWHSAPIVGSFSELDRLRSSQRLHQVTAPLINAFALMGGSVIFAVIYTKTRRKYFFYKAFSMCLASWSVFYVFLSGTMRNLNYFSGALLHYPVRVVAGIGCFALILAYRLLNTTQEEESVLRRRARVGFSVGALLVLLELLFALNSAATAQAVLFAITAPLAFTPMLGWRLNRAVNSRWQALVFFLSSITLFGQMGDAAKVLDGVINLGLPWGYSNRYTFPLLLGLSSLIFIAHFVGFFESLHIHNQRLQGLNESALALMRHDFGDGHESDLADRLRQSMQVRRSSLAVPSGNRELRIVGVAGIPEAAIGSIVLMQSRPEIAEAVRSRQIILGNVLPMQRDRFTTSSFAVVPVFTDEALQYVLLLADRLDGKAFEAADLPYLNQFSLMIAHIYAKHRARISQQEAERQFKQVVETLDPNLYAYVTLNTNERVFGDIGHLEARGIGFFDQVGYVSTLDGLGSQQELILVEMVKAWSAAQILRYGGSIKSFGGDAYLFACERLGEESDSVLANRLMMILWRLAQSLPQLNRQLLAAGLPHIRFRFGGHFGPVGDLDLLSVGANMRTIVGQNVNLVQRIQASAQPDQIRISADLKTLLGDTFSTTLIPESQLKGFSRGHMIYRVDGMLVDNDSLMASDDAA